MVRPLFLLFGFFCRDGIQGRGFGDFSSGIFGLGGPGTLGHLPLLSIFGVEVWLMGI